MLTNETLSVASLKAIQNIATSKKFVSHASFTRVSHVARPRVT